MANPEILNLENFGARLYYYEGLGTPFKLELDDRCAPTTEMSSYTNMEEALSDLINWLLTPEWSVYDMESVPDWLRKAYDLAGQYPEVRSDNPYTEVAYCFLYAVLEGIANANMRR